MKKGDEIWVRWQDDSVHQLRVTGTSTHGVHVIWQTGILKGKPALIEKETLREMISRK